MTLEIWQFVIIVIMIILITAVVTFFVTRKLFKSQLKKNPPITEDMIRTMMAQMGRTPSEKQVRAVMKSMNPDDEDEKTAKKKNNKKK